MIDMASENEAGLSPDEKIIRLCKERHAASLDYDSINRANFIDDVEFYQGEGQWPNRVKADRELENRPCLVVNRTKAFVRQVTNDALQNPISCKVRPVDDEADEETAEIFAGIIRHIESNSNADIAYQNAFFYSVVGGVGYFRVTTDYLPGSFDQEIYINKIANSLTVFRDPDSREPDGSDAKWYIIAEEVDRKQHEAEYPDDDENGGAPFAVNDVFNWVTKDTVTRAEYFYIETKKKKLYLLSSGEVVDDAGLAKIKNPKIEDEREEEIPVVKWCLIGGNKILDRKEWAGKYIPVIPIYGDTVEIKGRHLYEGMVRAIKDPQRMLNYYRSTETELLALTPKAPIMVAEGQLEGYEDKWATANTVNHAYLEYKQTDIEGRPAPMPQRTQFQPPPTGVLQGAQNAAQDMMDITSIHEAGLGARSNETSGRAILARQKEGDNATFHYARNKEISVAHCARILVDLIPKIYDTPRVVRVLGLDGRESLKKVNQQVTERDEYGRAIRKIYDLTVGTYDVVVSAGASYQTLRQEAAEAMTQMVQGNPQLMQVAGDLIMRGYDFPNADDIAERLRKTLPPELQDPEDEDGPQMPPEIKAQLDQAQQQMQAMQEQMAQMDAELRDKQMQDQLAMQKIQIEQFQAETARMKAERELELKAMELQAKMHPVDVNANLDPRNDVTESEKLNFDAELKIRLKEMEIEAAENLKLMDIKAKQLEADPTAYPEIDEDEGRPIGVRTVTPADEM